MKTKQSKTNTHLSRTSLLSEEGPVSLPEDLSIPTAQKEDRQGMYCLPEPQGVGQRKRSGIQPKKQDQRPLSAWMVEDWAAPGGHHVTSFICLGSFVQFAKTFLILPKAQKGPEKQTFWLRCESQGRAAMNCCMGCTHHKDS